MRHLETHRRLPDERRSSPAEAPLSQTLSYRLHLIHKLCDAVTGEAYTNASDLSLSNARCLATIGSYEPISVSDLAYASTLNKGQASRSAQALVDKALVSKTKAPDDQRSVTLRLTPRGRKTWAQTMAVVHRSNDDIFGCLDDHEQALLDDMFDRLVGHLGQALTTSGKDVERTAANTR